MKRVVFLFTFHWILFQIGPVNILPELLRKVAYLANVGKFAHIYVRHSHLVKFSIFVIIL